MAIRLKYIGKGTFLKGVPACDLTTAQAKQYGGLDWLLASGLYIENQPKAKTKNKPAEHIEEDL